MTHPLLYARTSPNKAAVVMAESGETLTFRELEERANQLAHLLRSIGLRRGDRVAAMLENCFEMFEIAWAADRAGLYFTTLPTPLTASESEYILRDSGAKALFTSSRIKAAKDIAALVPEIPVYMVGEAVSPPFISWREALKQFPTTPIEDESPGGWMLYSSGTTGRPKGVKPPLPEGSILTAPMIFGVFTGTYGAQSDWTYLSPAPLYHMAPLGWSMTAQRAGCTVVVMEKFDERQVLSAIETYGVNIAQFVPTHFIRMLKLPPEVRDKYDHSSLRTVFHAAAPCPPAIKEAMINWWGPIVHEYYSGTEGNGFTMISPEESLRKPGSVGRPLLCEVHACTEDGDPLPRGTVGQIFFAGGRPFVYHNDEEKTKSSQNALGWSSLGDIGWVDEDGYLFLTDRKSFMIISGGVNIYPQEIENLLVAHPKVADVAVIGAPDEELGERVVAVVQAADPNEAGEALAEELRQFCRMHLSSVKTPKQFDFRESLPRHNTGKLYKRLLRDEYWQKATT